MKAIFLTMAITSAASVQAQEFPNNLPLECTSGKQTVAVEIGRELFDGKGGSVRKAGSVGLRWASAQPVWARPEKGEGGGFKLSFAGRKPMVVKQTRQPIDENDYQAFISIQEEGGKSYQCGYAAG
jgi:hypothetical protein